MKILCATSRAQVRHGEMWRSGFGRDGRLAVAAQLAKTGVYKLIHEDFEPHFDKALPSTVVERRIL
jgi:hypothetical protein